MIERCEPVRLSGLAFDKERPCIKRGGEGDGDFEAACSFTRSNSFWTTSIKVSKLDFRFTGCFARTRRTTLVPETANDSCNSPITSHPPTVHIGSTELIQSLFAGTARWLRLNSISNTIGSDLVVHQLFEIRI